MIDRSELQQEIEAYFSKFGVELNTLELETIKKKAAQLQSEVSELFVKIGQFEASSLEVDCEENELEAVQSVEEIVSGNNAYQESQFSSEEATPSLIEGDSDDDSSGYETGEQTSENTLAESDEKTELEDLSTSEEKTAEAGQEITDSDSAPESVIERSQSPTKSGFALADKLRKSAVTNLSSVIGISEKYMFIQELFQGQTERYLKELNQLNDCTDHPSVMTHIDQLRNELNWNSESKAYLDLIELVERKFPAHE